MIYQKKESLVNDSANVVIEVPVITKNRTMSGVSNLTYTPLIGPLLKKSVVVEPDVYLKPTYLFPSIKCFYCNLIFDNLVRLETHQFLHKHWLEPNTKYFKQKIWVNCRRCEMELNFRAHKDTHRCYELVESDINSIYTVVNEGGLPMYCLLCEGKAMSSKSALIIHLIVFHSRNFDSTSCTICHCRFRSKKACVKDEHIKEQHLGDMEMNYLRTHRLSEGKSFSMKEFINPFLCTFKVGKNKICAKDFKNLATFTLHILCSHSPRESSRLNCILKPKTCPSHHPEMECNKCETMFDDHKSLKDHIDTNHLPDFDRLLDYHIRRRNFKFQFNPQVTCLLCMKVFPNHLAKDIHNYVCHWSVDWRQCGLCYEEIIKEDDLKICDNLQYRFIQVHEHFHIESIMNLELLRINKSPLLKDFHLSLVETPILYTEPYTPKPITKEDIKAQALRKRLLPKDVKRRLILIGNKNRKFQESLEIFG